MMKKIIFLLLLFLAALLHSQNSVDTLNKFNSRSNKQGYWLVYFSDTLIVTKNKADAFYYAYVYFDNGFGWDGLFCNNAAKWRKTADKFIAEGSKPVKGNPILLTGIFKYYDKNGNLTAEEHFTNGYPEILQNFSFTKKGKCLGKSVIDFSKPYNNQLCSFTEAQYDCEGKLKQSCYYGKNEKGKWQAIK